MSKARSISEDNIIYDISSNYNDNNLELLCKYSDFISKPIEPFAKQKAMPFHFLGNEKEQIVLLIYQLHQPQIPQLLFSFYL